MSPGLLATLKRFRREMRPNHPGDHYPVVDGLVVGFPDPRQQPSLLGYYVEVAQGDRFQASFLEYGW